MEKRAAHIVEVSGGRRAQGSSPAKEKRVAHGGSRLTVEKREEG
jgi:hypothetical protein